MQHASTENSWVVVATEIGSGGMVTTSTRRPRIPVTHMLAPPFIIDRAYATESPFRPKTRGRQTTRVTLSIGRRGASNASVENGDICPLSREKGNSNGAVGDAGRSMIPGSEIEP